jgi:dolichyl-phosphate beta-glucosyltransferase
VAALADHDVALGSRIQPDGSDMRASQPSYRRLLGKAFHLLASAWVVGPVKDTQCGFKGFTRAAAHDLFGRQRITSIVFDVEIIFLARRRGYRVAIVPIRWEDRRGSRMRARPALAALVAWDLFRIPLVHRGARRVEPAG